MAWGRFHCIEERPSVSLKGEALEILCSTGALIGRPNGRDYRLLEPLSKKLHCDGFEFMMYDFIDKFDYYVVNLQKGNVYMTSWRQRLVF